jgi:hypothetical protein
VRAGELAALGRESPLVTDEPLPPAVEEAAFLRGRWVARPASQQLGYHEDENADRDDRDVEDHLGPPMSAGLDRVQMHVQMHENITTVIFVRQRTG